MPEGVLKATEEVVGGLAKAGLAVALARVAEDDAEDVGLATLAVEADDGRAGAEVDLGLVAGVTLDAAEGEFVGLFEAVDEPADAVVAAGVAVVGDQVLVDPLCGEPEVALGPDQLPPRLTAAGPTAAAGLRIGCRAVSRGRELRRVLVPLRAGGRIGWFWRAVDRRRAGGRIGWF